MLFVSQDTFKFDRVCIEKNINKFGAKFAGWASVVYLSLVKVKLIKTEKRETEISDIEKIFE